MSSFVVLLCRIIVVSEGLIGLALNAIVFARLWSRKMLSGWSTHRIGMSFSAIHGCIISMIAISSCIVHLFHYENVMLIVYGPIAYLPQVLSDIAVFSHCIFVIGVWHFLPASSILQYLSLCKPHFSDLKRVVLSYSLSCVLLVFSLPHYSTFYAPAPLLERFENITRRVHQIELDVFNVYGATLFATPPYKESVLNIAAFAIFPQYGIAYAVFIGCCARISHVLNSYGVKLSTKTKGMQRRFLKMMLMQNLLPLIVLSVPIGILIATLISDIAMDNKTLAVTFSIWALPIVQGAVALFYVNGIGSSSPKNSQNASAIIRTASSVVKHSEQHLH